MGDGCFGPSLGTRFNLTPNQRYISKILLIVCLITLLPIIFSSYMLPGLVLAAQILIAPVFMLLVGWIIYSFSDGESRSQKGILEPDTAKLRGEPVKKLPESRYLFRKPPSAKSPSAKKTTPFVPFSGAGHQLIEATQKDREYRKERELERNRLRIQERDKRSGQKIPIVYRGETETQRKQALLESERFKLSTSTQ